MDRPLLSEPDSLLASVEQERVREAHAASGSNVRFPPLLVAILIVLGVGQIVLTYRVFNHTVDEPAHLAAGMEWWDGGTYQYEALHPPLARVAIALGPYVSGLRSTGEENIWTEGKALLNKNDNYWRNLTLARAGIIPFFVLASVLVWIWARAEFGALAGLFAILLFVTLPPILGHSALATTDLAFAATFLAAMFAFVRWLDHATLFRSAVMGVAVAGAVLTKFSALPFLGVTLPALVALRLVFREGKRPQSAKPKLRWQLAVALAVMVMMVFTAYRFSIGSISRHGVESAKINRYVGQQGRLHDVAYKAVALPVPAPEFFRGVWELYDRESKYLFCYVLGHSYKNGGPWFFFLVALAVKTPIPLLLTAAAGMAVVAYAFAGRNRRSASLIAVPFLLLAISSLSPLKIGLRHILPIYPFLAILGGAAMAHLWQLEHRRVLARLAVAGLLTWQLWCVGSTAPDYLAYFNEFAGDHPDYFLVDSDLDWGQDLFRLGRALRDRKVDHVSLAYFGNANPNALGLPPYTILYANQQTTGWVAISEFVRKYHSDGYGWLDQYQPVARAGKSIRIYYIPLSPGAGPK